MRKREVPLIMAKGFCMGMADLVPGVSGGTMAFILGIYTRLLAAIRSFDKVWLLAILKLDVKTAISRPHFSFLIPLLIGLFCAVLFFTRVISLPDLMRESPEHIYGLFFGLIVASIIVLMRELKGFTFADAVTLLLGTAAGLLIINLVPVETPNASWFIFLSGCIAICAMILPGLSGAFLLLILKKYDTIIAALGNLDFGIIIPFILGCVTGLAGFSRLLGWLLEKFYQRTLLVIKGILIASLWMLWPFQQRQFETVAGHERLVSSQNYLPAQLDNTVIGVVGLVIIGLVTVLIIHTISQRKGLT